MIRLPAKILVTGTDTGVGKTFVSGELIRLVRERGLRVKACKPLESGVENIQDSDAYYLSQKLQGIQDVEDVAMYRLEEPLSPHIAAKRQGVQISKPALIERIETLAKDTELLIVEGAGGLCVPILNDYTFADLARDTELSILFVAANKLGVINHLLLSNAHAVSRGLDVLPYILNDVSGDVGLAGKTNKEAIEMCSSLRCLAHLRFKGVLSQDVFEDISEPASI
jgi:dethiobiotin synthetase